ncbi:MAG: hypothetical protein ACM3PY_14375, partial [Omnitrophica WOR_2 bacterium]
VPDGSTVAVQVEICVNDFEGTRVGAGVMVGEAVCAGVMVGVPVDVPTIATIRNERLGAAVSDATKIRTKIAIPRMAACR